MSRRSTSRNSKSRLSTEPARILQKDENKPPRLSSANRFSAGRPSLGKSFLPNTTFSTGAGVGNVQRMRLSSGYGRGFARSDVMKDPRPISDKSYMHQCIKSLTEYLLLRGYPHPISPKVLQSPQSKDFFRIFEFLFSILYDPKYKLGPKPEEEIPQLMKMIGYRFTISKSSLFTIGTAHTWPHLLAALTWLKNSHQICVLASEDIESLMFPFDDDNFDGLPIARIQMNYMGRTYEAFLCGKDTYEEEDEELLSILSQNLIGSASDLETLEADNKRLTSELCILEQNPDKVPLLEGDLESLLADEYSFSKYLQELNTHIADQQKVFEDSEEELLALQAELKAAQDNENEMQKILETQEFRPVDVQRMKQGLQEMQNEVSSLERGIEALDSDIWTMEMNVGKSQAQTEQKCHEYNKRAQLLKLIPSNTPYARGRDLEMKNCYSESMNSNFATAVKPALHELKTEFKERANDKAQSRITLIEALEQFTEQKSQKQEDVEMKERKLKRIDEDLNCKKEMFQRELLSIDKQSEEKQEELLQLRRSVQTGPEEQHQEVIEAQKHLDLRKAQMEKSESEYDTFLRNVVHVILEHKTAIQDGVEEVCTQMKRLLNHVEQTPYSPLFPDGKPERS